MGKLDDIATILINFDLALKTFAVVFAYVSVSLH